MSFLEKTEKVNIGFVLQNSQYFSNMFWKHMNHIFDFPIQFSALVFGRCRSFQIVHLMDPDRPLEPDHSEAKSPFLLSLDGRENKA